MKSGYKFLITRPHHYSTLLPLNSLLLYLIMRASISMFRETRHLRKAFLPASDAGKITLKESFDNLCVTDSLLLL